LAQEDILIPEKIGNYTLTGKNVFPDSLYGVVYNYDNNGRGYINLYIYPVLDEVRNKDINAVEFEVNMFIASLPELKARGIYDSVSVIRNESITFGKREGRVVVMNILRDGRELRSLLYIFSEDNTYLKIRATYPKEDDQVQEVEKFIANLFDEITWKDKDTDKKEGEATIVLNYEVMKKQNLSEYWLIYGAALGAWDAKSLSDNALEAYEREVFVRSKVASIWIDVKENDNSVVDKGLDDLAKIYRAGFMREYVWKYMDVPKTPEPNGLRHTEFESWEKINLIGHTPVVNTGVSIEIK
jgi:hypothetical protein